MKVSFPAILGLGRKKTMTQKIMAADKKKLFLFGLLAAGAAFGVQRAAPMLAGLIMKR